MNAREHWCRGGGGLRGHAGGYEGGAGGRLDGDEVVLGQVLQLSNVHLLIPQNFLVFN